MTITIEQIDALMARTNVSYQVAKELLEKHNGNIVEAILEAEKQNIPKGDPTKKSGFSEFKEKASALLKLFLKIIEKLLIMKLVWKKNQKSYLELPLLIILVLFFWLFPLSLILLILPYFFGIRTIFKWNQTEWDLGKWLNNKTE
jgi:hypothetical protein